MKRRSPTFWIFLVLWLGFGLAVVVTGRAQVTPTAGITKAQAPLVRVGNTVVLDSNGGITIAHLKATIGTFGNLTVTGTCTGCGGGSGGGGGGGGGSTSIVLSTIGTLTSWWDASKNVYSDTSCSAAITTGGTIACWKDQVNGLAAKEVAANKDPIYAWQDRLGHPGVRMNQDPNTQNNGARLTTASTGAPIPAAYTACAIYRMAAPYGNFPAGNTFQIFEEADGTPRGLGMLVGLAEPQVGTQFRTTINASGTGSLVTTPVNYALANSVVEQCSLVNATKMQTIVDGMASPTTATGASVQDGNVVFVLGNGDYSASAQPYTLYEVFQFNSVVTGTGLTAIFTYGRQKYGVNDAVGSSSGGSTAPADPITVNGWTPASGTGTVAGALAVSGAASDTGHTTTGDSHVTGNLTVDGTISGIGLVYGYLPFHVDQLSSSTSTNQNETSFLVQKAMTLVACTFTPTSIGFSSDTCSHLIVDATGGGTICTVSTSCATNTITSSNCTGAVIPANHFLTYKRTISGLFSATAAPGNFACSYSEQP